MSHYLRTALEGNNSEVEAAEGGIEDGAEYDIARVSQDVDAEFEDSQSLSAVMENLSGYAVAIESLIANNACTPGTMAVLRLAIEQQLGRIHAPFETVSLEAHTEDIVRQHEIALEGLRYFLDKYLQACVISTKHRLNAVGDFFRSTHGQINKYRAKLDDTESEYLSKKKDWHENQHDGSLVELWYHFATGEGQAKNVLQAVTHDLTLSSYILKSYSSELTGIMSKLNSALKSVKIKGVKDVEKLLADVQKLKSGGEVFEQRYVGGHPYLSVTGLTMKRGDRRRAIEIGGKSFPKMAELATPYTAVETGKWTHTGKKVGANFTGHLGMAANYVLSAKIQMSTDDIGKLIKAGHTYLDNVEDYLSKGTRFLSEASAASHSMVRAMEQVSGDLDASSRAAVLAGFKQIEQYMNNLIHCYQNPAKSEVARSIKGAKYNMYLALRMIYNAK